MKNKHNEDVGSDIKRTDERIDSTGEVFTPLELCQQMIREISEEGLKNPESKFIDPAAGNGNFLVALLDELKNYHPKDHILNHMIYAVELMEDNHQELCNRLGVSTTHPHYVCANAMTYDYSFGEPVGLENFYGN